MSDNPFLKQQEQKNSHHRPDKTEMHHKCENVLEQIKKYSEESYASLNRTFLSSYDRPNVQKKKILGFYGTLVETLKKLKASAGESLVSQKPPSHSLDPMALIQQKPVTPPAQAGAPTAIAEKKVAKKVEKKTEDKASKKVVKKAAAKSEDNKVTKKVAKKVEKKAPAKKAAPKAASKPAAKTVKKTAKKVAKKK